MATAARGVGIVVAGAGASCVVAFAATRLLATPVAPKPCPSERCRRDTFDAAAKKWDETVRFDEFITGIGRQRKRLAQHARGDVLEVAIGSGRNFPYYNSAKVKSVTGVDFSKSMLQAADGKREQIRPIELKLKVASSQHLDFPDDTFDSVVDSFGICSFESPVESLQEMRRVCKEDGRILLLEHGASNWEIVQGMLNSTAQGHAEKYGCYPNRDITGLVKQAGLHVITDERSHFGTTYFLVCGKNPPAERE